MTNVAQVAFTAGFARVAASSQKKYCSSSSEARCSMSAADLIDGEVTANDIMVFSKSYCPFCSRTKALFTEMGVDFEVMELDLRNDGDDIQAALAEKTGQRTVPNVFIKGTHLGGNDDTQAAARSGKLAQLLGYE
eukprot:CAMPEP_0117756384 /NCGR_PEP_ID=MMETSP0947-20121206/14045_1 /TAXON_ID=44440 /ORGANISM="Chattonella subsalsa, Strain CCMP2191" /LENGTH=134 /DNA_ID=CAMNT_0005575959 /DNA_START=144 /DNA_END=548 /DNA_ORIENTATION=+